MLDHGVDHGLLSSWKREIYAFAESASEELALASHALHEGTPPTEAWTDFLDFFSLEWVDAEGYTVVERAVRAGRVPEGLLRWPHEVRTALWVVDGWKADRVRLRDVATEEELDVHAPGAEADLTRRTVLRARVVPLQDRRVFLGEPDLYGEMGVIARMDLMRAWQEGPEPALLARLRDLRAAFRRQREERDAFIAHFGKDEVIFSGAAEMEARLAVFVSFLLNEFRFPSLAGATRTEAWRVAKGDEPKLVQFTLGPTLTGPGRPGVIYDDVEGVHFLPAYGEFVDHLRGVARHPDLVRAYLEDPGITPLPFRRAHETTRLAALLGVADAPLDVLLGPWKGGPRRATPSVLPGLED